MSDEKRPNPIIRAINWLNDGWNWAQLFFSVGSATWVAQMTGYDWTATPVPWLLTASTGLGAFWLVMVVHTGYTRWRRHRNPSRLTVTPDPGVHGCLGLVLRGEPVVLSAVGRITRVVDGVNPSPHRFDCRLSRGGKGEVKLPMKDGDFAQIVLASRQTFKSEPLGDDYGLVVHRGGTVVPIPDSGAEIEVSIRSDPPLGRNEHERIITVRVSWDGTITRVEELSSR